MTACVTYLQAIRTPMVLFCPGNGSRDSVQNRSQSTFRILFSVLMALCYSVYRCVAEDVLWNFKYNFITRETNNSTRVLLTYTYVFATLYTVTYLCGNIVSRVVFIKYDKTKCPGPIFSSPVTNVLSCLKYYPSMPFCIWVIQIWIPLSLYNLDTEWLDSISKFFLCAMFTSIP